MSVEKEIIKLQEIEIKAMEDVRKILEEKIAMRDQEIVELKAKLLILNK